MKFGNHIKLYQYNRVYFHKVADVINGKFTRKSQVVMQTTQFTPWNRKGGPLYLYVN